MHKILYFLRHNSFLILCSKILHWDELKYRIRSVKMKCKGNIIRLHSSGPFFYLPYFKTDHIQRIIFKTCNYYDVDLLDFICNKWNDALLKRELCNASILDIGSNIGNHSIFFFFHCNIKESYNFEPVKDTFNILSKNIELNKLNAHLYNIGIGAKKSQANILKYDKSNIGATQIKLNKTGNITISSIDELQINSKIKLVKIDVEGFEKDVIYGMQALINRDKPFILIELWNKNLDAIDKNLKDHGYARFDINKDDSLGNYLYYIE